MGFNHLEVAGIVALSGLSYILTQCVVPMFMHCDNSTFWASMPGDAFKDKVVWVTGASSGIGRELAKQLARQGAKLILSSRRLDALSAVRQECLEINELADVRIVVLDLENLDSLSAKAAEALAMHDGKIDVLINNGGLWQHSIARETNFGVDDRLTKIDFLSYVKLAKLVLPSMSQCSEKGSSTPRGGHIVNMGSGAGKGAVPLRTAYCGAKFGLMGFFDALRVEEYALGSNVMVTNVCPGFVKTNITRNALLKDNTTYGKTAEYIENGLSVEYVCERTLAGVHSGLDELWIADPLGMLFTYGFQYAPTVTKWLVKRMGRGLMEWKLGRTLDEKKVQ